MAKARGRQDGGGEDKMMMTAVILAGGKSARFGHDKALLEIGGQTLLQRTVSTMRLVTADVIVLGPPERAQQAAGVEVLQDAMPGIGPLGGILTALQARPGGAIFAVAVDMPFLSAPLLSLLIEAAADVDIVLPVVDGRGQQLHAVYGPGCLPFVRAQIAAGDYKIDRFFGKVRVKRIHEAVLRTIDPHLDAFRNVNTPALWEAALAVVASGPAGPDA